MMEVRLYNTLTRSIEKFVPIEGKDFVGVYSCGPTVYGDPHIGNLKYFVFTDIVRNVLTTAGYKVKHVMNITDVGHLTDDADNGEDKMEKGSRITGRSVWEVAKMYEENFHYYLQQLHIAPYTNNPRATEHIEEQINMIKTLEQKGYTYRTSDGIYFDSTKFDDYTKLSGIDVEGMQGGARVDLGEKKHITDFALWKFSFPEDKRQMEWDSPWGRGFPGWHIECSAMASKYLGEWIDIHTGGVDHLSVHHPNEIAQSECTFGHQWVKYWLHVQFLTVKGQKISKSLGNTITLPQLEEAGYDPLDVRMLFLQSHYRTLNDFSFELMDKAKATRKSLIAKLSGYSGTSPDTRDELYISLSHSIQEIALSIMEALCDDFNTVKALTRIHESLNHVTDDSREEMLRVIHFFDKKIVKCNFFEKEQVNIPEEIKRLAEKRLEEKSHKNFVVADQLRSEIESRGFEIKDTREGYTLTKK